MTDVFFDYDACTVDALNRALDERLRTQAAEIERLRAALRQVAAYKADDDEMDWADAVLTMNEIARAALEEGRT